jgi:hypothetical protein
MSQPDRQSHRRKRGSGPAAKKRARSIFGEPLPPDLLQCSKALVRPVSKLRKRYPASTVILAMLSQSAGFLRLLRERRVLTHAQARQACERFTRYVLADRRRGSNSTGRVR